MRRPTVILATLLGLAALAAPVAEASWTIKGRGFGHGVGMSQYGAYGFALQGWTYDRILAHYYRGTQVGSASPRQVRVLLATGRPALTVSAATATDRKGAKYTLAPGRQTIGPRLEVATTAGRKKLASPVRFAGGVTLGGNAYRGSLVVYSSSGVLSAVNHVGLEEYLYGVVPWEMPSTWAREALKAQAVVARSYALATLKPSATFDLYADTRSQVYGGIRAETARTNQAVAETALQVVLYRGEVAETYFSSTSGGHTENNEFSFLGGTPEPYLRGVPDPYDGVSPYHRWTRKMGLRQIERRLGGFVRGRLKRIKAIKRGASPRIVKAKVVATRGVRRISGPKLRARLGLRDTWAHFVKRKG